ncbi:MAG: branched-chain amino acid transport system permease protein [Thermomicrobiales bacterium]|jgi:branched-chain amino acid transport system permease protein|nr:branched-chain amino acid transport system permease protein [Thermomicrobiales bacterium]MEA2598115.1 branched-chain amino acid transport system permease protein [Thermomicrobiales bacterium]
MHFNETLFLQYLILGVASGGLIALIALGYTLVYGVVELINFAHGDVFMMGAFFALTVVSASSVTGKSSSLAIIGVILAALFLSMMFSAAINFGIDRIAYRRLRNAPRLAPLIAAIGVSFVLQNLGIYWKGANSISPPSLIPADLRSYNVLNEIFNLNTRVRLRPLDVAVIVLPIPLLIGLTWFVYKTRTGKAMRATAQDREAAALMGIDVNRSIATAFLLGGAMAGAAGMIALYYNSSANYHMGFRYGLYAFTAAVLGGIGNLGGAVLGGLLIGLVWSFSDGFMKEYISGWGAQWTPSVIFGVLVLVMVFRPTGLLGEATADKV